MVDVLVSGDGTVRDVALRRSCGYPQADRAYLVAYRAARFPPMPADYRSLLYVTRQTTFFERTFPSKKDFLGDVPPAETPNLYRY